MREFYQDSPHSSPMITLDHLGESFVFNCHISSIENNAYFNFGGGGGGGGISLYFKNFLASIILFLMFSFSFLCLDFYVKIFIFSVFCF